jgi:monoamine oxidase
MAHSPLLNKFLAIGRLVAQTPDPELDLEAALRQDCSRRQFIKQAAALGVGAGLAGLPAMADAMTYKSARIAIVGAGLAGLRAAYELKKAGINATIYEANPSRIGGRCFSNTTSFGQNVTENGGELIDTSQTNIQKLAAELGLILDDCGSWQDALGLEELYHVNGHLYTAAQAFNDFKLMANQLNQDRAHAPFPQTWNNCTVRGLELDRMTVAQYIAAYAPGGAESDFGKVLNIAYTIEYGAETSEQSAYNLVSLLGYSNTTTHGSNSFYLFGTSDERFHIRGGNDQLVTRMAATLAPGQIELGCELKRLVLNSDNTYSLAFKSAAGNRTVVADHVVMAIPFSILRSSVDFSGARFDGRKVTAINTMPIGNNCKFQLQFNRRIWHDYKLSGETYSDLGYQDTWEATRAQPTTTACINNFTGGATALAYSEVSDLNAQAKFFLAQWERLVPGCTAQWNGKVVLNNWPKNPWTRGAYGYYAPGNYSSFVGYEGTRQFNCHFCGEHTSLVAQGYLEGAVETGQRCAKEIMDDLKKA